MERRKPESFAQQFKAAFDPEGPRPHALPVHWAPSALPRAQRERAARGGDAMGHGLPTPAQRALPAHTPDAHDLLVSSWWWVAAPFLAMCAVLAR